MQYIGIEPSFPHHINSFDNVPVNYSRGPLENITVRSNSVQFYTNKINYTLQGAGLTYNTFLEPFDRNKILLFMNSMFLAGSIEMNTPDVRPINLTVVSNAISVN